LQLRTAAGLVAVVIHGTGIHRVTLRAGLPFGSMGPGLDAVPSMNPGSTNRHRVCSWDPWDRDSSSYTPGRVATANRCGPGCRCDPWAGTRCSPLERTPDRVAAANRCGPGCRCDPWAGTRCSPLDEPRIHKPPPGLQLGSMGPGFIESYTPGRVAAANRSGPCFDLLTMGITQ
jgi:hypothetical protein